MYNFSNKTLNKHFSCLVKNNYTTNKYNLFIFNRLVKSIKTLKNPDK